MEREFKFSAGEMFFLQLLFEKILLNQFAYKKS